MSHLRSLVLVAALTLSGQAAFAQTANSSPGYVPPRISAPPAFQGEQTSPSYQATPQPFVGTPGYYQATPLPAAPRPGRG